MTTDAVTETREPAIEEPLFASAIPATCRAILCTLRRGASSRRGRHRRGQEMRHAGDDRRGQEMRHAGDDRRGQEMRYAGDDVAEPAALWEGGTKHTDSDS